MRRVQPEPAFLSVPGAASEQVGTPRLASPAVHTLQSPSTHWPQPPNGHQLLVQLPLVRLSFQIQPPSLFTLPPASKRWIVDRSTLHQARSDDLQYVDNPEYLGFLNIFFANREPISPVQPLAPVSSLIVPTPSQ